MTAFKSIEKTGIFAHFVSKKLFHSGKYMHSGVKILLTACGFYDKIKQGSDKYEKNYINRSSSYW